MTLQELSQIFYLEREIDLCIDKLLKLRESADVRSPILSDMPRAPGVRDKLGEIVPSIIDQEAELTEHIRRCQEEKQKLEHFIMAVPFSRVRSILTMRCKDCMPWQAIADTLGGKETENSVRKTAERYLKSKIGA